MSKSYKEDLIESSPLSPLLNKKSLPFAHLNGIPIEDRIKKLDKEAKNHLIAKENTIDEVLQLKRPR